MSVRHAYIDRTCFRDNRQRDYIVQQQQQQKIQRHFKHYASPSVSHSLWTNHNNFKLKLTNKKKETVKELIANV